MPHGFAVGAPCWFDVTAPDIDATAEFYRALFGWSAHDTGPEFGHYTALVQDDAPVAGITRATTPDGATRPAAWLPYFAVAELGPAVETATADGATVFVAPVEVPGQLEFAILADPAGAGYGLAHLTGHPGTERWGAPNNPVWVQYTATGAPAEAMAHYAKVLGWHYRNAAWETATDKPYQALTTAAGGREFGGAAAARPGEPAPFWGVTMHVVDCDTTAARALAWGGKIIQEPQDNPGPSRVAVISDPAGAALALMAFG
ncbi:VOC family protein [Nocardia sp. CDC159]|uniref:VOC family protein n=1 Tax=Nocardia pulmonis TaxID=2951408 RepID=A0A9X2E156_9NOCA|nr:MULTISPECIES: VOC family protein [Nocardia]MCM6772244.1 VOC family protein [Nocardia pulmonis]MCM6785098.1 VOC family protein [Nocardia sp. CDC159]